MRKDAQPITTERDPIDLERLISKSQKVKDAYELAELSHGTQLRLSGEPYIIHPEAVTNIVLGWINPGEIDASVENLACASLLHDSVEDTTLTLDEIQKKFSDEVAEIVQGVTLLRSDKSPEDQERENLQFIADKGYLTPKVFLLKLADRLHNMRTLNHVKDENKRKKKADETMRIYTKLAESMGMWEVKTELEDLSFPHILPNEYNKFMEIYNADPRTSPEFITGMEEKLTQILSENGINCQVVGRPNGLWTLYNKMQEAAISGQGKPNSLSGINDVISFRVVTSDKDLVKPYTLMGHVRTNKDFISLMDQERSKDYINSPRDNRYSALQTTLELPRYGAVEIAFVTEEMEDFNNQGIINLIKKSESLEQYRRNLVFDESGEAWFLPLDATWVDYVYAVGIGAQARAVEINGQEIALTETSCNAVSVMILTHSDLQPHDQELLNHSLSPTQKMIRAEITMHEHNALVDQGRKMMQEVLKPLGLLDIADCETAKEALISYFSKPPKSINMNEIYYLLGNGNITPEVISQILTNKGISKETLGLTTIQVSGLNRPGILSFVADLIRRSHGDVRSFQQNTIYQEKGPYTIKLVVKGLTTNAEKRIKTRLSKDPRFKSVIVI